VANFEGNSFSIPIAAAAADNFILLHYSFGAQHNEVRAPGHWLHSCLIDFSMWKPGRLN